MTQTAVSPADTLVPVAGSWLWPLFRGLIALAVGLAIAFTSHLNTPLLALIFFAAYTLLTGILQFFFLYRKNIDAGAHTWSMVQAQLNTVAGAVAAISAIAIANANTSGSGEVDQLWGTQIGQTRIFVYTLLIWAIAMAFIELFLGLSRRKKIAEARDWTLIGVLTAALAAVTVLIDPALRVEYVITDKNLPDYHGAVTGSVTALGFFGVYLVTIGIFLLIGMVSLKNDSSQMKGASS